jgi:uncharacterized membrane-anchored protein YhcB (DUF1043 family)
MNPLEFENTVIGNESSLLLDEDYYPILGIIIGIILFYYIYKYWNENKIQIIDTIEIQLNKSKEIVSIYTNKLLLYFNMQGSAVKTTNKL